VLLKDALMPNLVQTLEHNPAFIHGGPFANIAHGCNSVIATRAALKLADYVVTEAGFGADLGAEKFFDIKCRKAGLMPDAAVIVATVRALKMHGGVAREDLGRENLGALRKGMANLNRHVQNVRSFGVPAVVAVNHFAGDTEAEHALVRSLCAEHGVQAITCRHWAEGGAGAAELAEHVVHLCEAERFLDGRGFQLLYPDEMPLWEKMATIATTIYGADEIIADKRVRDQFAELQAGGYGHFPICVAKTQYSFSTDPNLKGAPRHHVVPIRELRLASGAEFLVVICGDIMTMPGLPRVPAASAIGMSASGEVEGLF
jgi:formate--tetrahydrofolate ligase